MPSSRGLQVVDAWRTPPAAPVLTLRPFSGTVLPPIPVRSEARTERVSVAANRGRGMAKMLRRRISMASLAVAGLLGIGLPARAEDVVFLSTQLRPIESAQAMRTTILNGIPGVTFVTEQPPQLGVHIRAEQEAGKPVTSLVGALHGELLPLVGNLQPLDKLAASL